MAEDLERNLGEQPLAALLTELKLQPNDLVVAAGSQMTHKMISRACRGRRLTTRMQYKVLAALNAASGREYRREQLFNYS